MTRIVLVLFLLTNLHSFPAGTMPAGTVVIPSAASIHVTKKVTKIASKITSSTVLSTKQMQAFVIEQAPKYGLDPAAVLAVGQAESGWSNYLGDYIPGTNSPTSFGPFQLHETGALPPSHDADGATWARTEAGLNYALSAMAKTPAKGLKGSAAVQQLVTHFERPLNIPGEVQRADTYLPHWQAVTASPTTVSEAGLGGDLSKIFNLPTEIGNSGVQTGKDIIGTFSLGEKIFSFVTDHPLEALAIVILSVLVMLLLFKGLTTPSQRQTIAQSVSAAKALAV